MASKPETPDPLRALEFLRQVIRHELVISSLMAHEVALQAERDKNPIKSTREAIDAHVTIANVATRNLCAEMEKLR